MCIQACRIESRDKLLTDAHCTLLAFNGSAFAARFSYFIIEFFGDDLASYRNSSISIVVTYRYVNQQFSSTLQ